METREAAARYYGWRVTGAAHFGLMLGFSLYACTFGVFVKPLGNSFGWTRESIAGGFAVSALTVACFSPLIGSWLDRHDSRALLLAGIFAFGCSFLALAFLTHSIWHFYLICFLIGAVGNIMQMGYTQAVSTWFSRHRGIALGAMLSGEAVGIILFPIAMQSLIASSGWRFAYALVGALVLLVSLPLALFYARSNPHRHAASSAQRDQGSTLLQSLGNHIFWVIAGVLFLSSISVNGALTHQVPLLTDRGIAPAAAAMTVSVLGGSSLIGRLLAGWLLDRVQGTLLSCSLLLLTAFGIVLLAQAKNLSVSVVAAVLLGLGAGGTSSTTPYLLTRYFGSRSFSTLYGLTWTFYAIAGGGGPVLLGFMYDRTGSYTITLLILGAVTALGSFLMMLLPSYDSTATAVGSTLEPSS